MKATVLVRPKPGILDPQGQAVESSLRHLGFAVAEANTAADYDQLKHYAAAALAEAKAKGRNRMIIRSLSATTET